MSGQHLDKLANPRRPAIGKNRLQRFFLQIHESVTVTDCFDGFEVATGKGGGVDSRGEVLPICDRTFGFNFSPNFFVELTLPVRLDETTPFDCYWRNGGAILFTGACEKFYDGVNVASGENLFELFGIESHAMLFFIGRIRFSKNLDRENVFAGAARTLVFGVPWAGAAIAGVAQPNAMSDAAAGNFGFGKFGGSFEDANAASVD